MKLLHDCVRDVLLTLEDKLGVFGGLGDNQLDLPKYSSDDIKYTILKLNEAGYITCSKSDLVGNIYIKSITYQGHLFLDNIRDNNVWKKTKSIASKFSSTSLTIISSIASQVIAELISKQLNNP